MKPDKLLEKLGYDKSPNFLRGRSLSLAPDYGHIFRRAHEKPCRLHGVYTLRDPNASSNGSIVPVVYVCKATSESAADEIHRLVWNQAVVPFVLVLSPTSDRLYSGFRYQPLMSGSDRGLLRTLNNDNDIKEIVDSFSADSIDDGKLWRNWGREVTPDKRVDSTLLAHLRKLDRQLRVEGDLTKEVSHALIGKYVFLHYLKDRGILSPEKLDRWGVAQADIFGRNAKLAKLKTVTHELDKWLNGCVFPLRFRGQKAPEQKHITWVAGTFAGDEPLGDGNSQLHLDFERYNFKYIPIETLSVIYEQFLHAPDDDKSRRPATGKTTKGKEVGAYYTPLPVVNLMLAEMDDRRRLERGMRVCDSSCGSGAFLVQCYRRLIERSFPHGTNQRLRVPQLRKLLEDHIFGVDCDPDACSVTELSLTLTLLDYVHPPDLENDTRVKLPSLRNQNIFCANFFDEASPHLAKIRRKQFDWIVGNPPWKKLKSENLAEEDRHVLAWINDNGKQSPVGNREVARAFAWRVTDYLAPSGEIALLLPAMSLFETAAQGFRAAFFKRMKVHTVANFANLTEVLFGGRSRVPAAAFFYRNRTASERVASPFSETRADECITAYSPLVANQEPTRPIDGKTRTKTWSLVINASEIRNISIDRVSDGSSLPWKLATWGSHLDRRLLARLERRFQSLTLEDLEVDGILVIREGSALRAKHVATGRARTRRVEEVVGKKLLDVNRLKGLRHVFSFPHDAILENKKFYLSVRGGEGGLAVCQAPHIVVNAGRNFAIYTADYLIVPPRQIGIISPSKDTAFLKALSLFLSSDFAFYHQFLTSSQFGIKRDVATLDALKKMPIPLSQLTKRELNHWTKLHAELVRMPPWKTGASPTGQMEFSYGRDKEQESVVLLKRLNDVVSDILGLDPREQALIHDLKHVRLELNDGRTGELAVGAPGRAEIRTYARRLKSELDAFIGNELSKWHSVGVVYDELSAMVCVNLTRDANAARRIIVERAGSEGARQLERTRPSLRLKVSQWVYFDRNLRLYEGTRTYLFKPMQRFHWTESQAMFDAGEIIGEVLTGRSGEASC